MSYTRITLEQGTDDWLAWRMRGIGASEVPAIMGENPWKTRSAVLAEKCGLTRSDFNSAAMDFGTRTEPEARAHYVATVGFNVEPECVQSTAREWLRASLDGLSADGARVVEIKCGPRVYAKTAKDKLPPKYYVGQLQHILAVTALPGIDFWCYMPGRPPVHVAVERDDAYIARMLVAEAAFWAEVQDVRARRSR